MSEALGGSRRRRPANELPTSATYRESQPLYARTAQAKDAERQRQRDNKRMARALDEIKREPPKVFHAPMSYDSLKHGGQVKSARDGKASDPQPCTEHHVDVAPWPPLASESAHITRARRQREIDEANCKLAKKLVEQLTTQRVRAHSAHSPAATRHLTQCRGPALLPLWAMRTALYLPSAPPMHSPFADAVATAATLQQRQQRGAPEEGEAPQTTVRVGGGDVAVSPSAPAAPRRMARPRSAASLVPKTLGLAKCSGCGARGFHRADGVHLEPCRHCKQVWYCSEVCAKADWLSHKALCKWQTTGHWEPFGRKAEQEHWVNNAALGEVRRELNRRGAAAEMGQAARTDLLQRTLAGGAMVQDAYTRTFADAATPQPGAQPSSSLQRQQTGDAGSGSAIQGQTGALDAPQPSLAPGVSQAGALLRQSCVGTGRVPSQREAQVEAFNLQLDEADELQVRYRRARARELELQRRQDKIEERAFQGLDGPRPCMYMGGKRV